MKKTGSKEEVYRGLAKHTAGGLTKADLKLNKKGKVVSAAKSRMAKKANNLGLGSGISRRGAGIVSDLLGSIGLGLKKKGKKRARKGKGIPASRGGRKAKRGAGAFDDFMTGFTAPLKVAKHIVPFIL